MPKFSVIVPVYNTEKYLKKCLNSIFNQSYKDFEVIIINDGSTDDSEKIINEFIDKSIIKVIYKKVENQGVANARNLGINLVSSEYFIFVDSDDFIEKNLLFELVQNIKNEEIDLLKYKAKIIFNDRKQLIKGPVFNKLDGEQAFNKMCWHDKLIDTPCLYAFNTKFYKSNNFLFSNNTYHEDFGLIPLIILKAKSVNSINVYGYNYIQSENSITRNLNYNKTIKKAYDMFLHYDNMEKEIEKFNLSKKTNENIKIYYTNSIILKTEELKGNDRKKYIKEIKKRKLLKNIQAKTIKQIVKKFIIYTNINWYLKVKNYI